MSVPDLAAAFIADAASERGWSANYVAKLTRFVTTHVSEHLDIAARYWEVADSLLAMDAAAARLGPSSRKQLLSLLRQTAKYGMQRGVLEQDPTAGIQVTSPSRHQPTAVEIHGAVSRFIEVDERPSTVQVERLAAALDCDGYDGLTARLGGYCGLRFSETFALESSDFDLSSRIIRIERQVDPYNHSREGTVMTPDGRRRRYWQTPHGPAALPKGDRTRTVLLPEHLVNEVAKRPAGLLFPSMAGTYMRNQAWWNRAPFGRARLWAGWPLAPNGQWVWTWHTLRHHAATWMLERGIPIHDVSDMLGHNQVETTLRMYVHTESGAAARAAASTMQWLPPPASLQPSDSRTRQHDGV